MSAAGFIIAIAIIAGNCWLIGVMWKTRAGRKLGGDGAARPDPRGHADYDIAHRGKGV